MFKVQVGFPIILGLLTLGHLVIGNCGRSIGLFFENGWNQTVVDYDLEYPVLPKIKLEEEILRLMGFPDEPKNPDKIPTRKRSAPEFLETVYEYSRELERDKQQQNNNMAKRYKRESANHSLTEDDYRLIEESQVIMTFMAQKLNTEYENSDDIKRMWFDIPEIANNVVLTYAQLRLYRHSNSVTSKTRGTFLITINQIFYSNSGNKELYFTNSVNTTDDYEGWVMLDITKTLNYWMRNKDNNCGIRISIEALNGTLGQNSIPENIGIVGFDGDEEKKPFIVGYYRDSGGKSIQLDVKRLVNKFRYRRDSIFPVDKFIHPYISNHRESDELLSYPCSFIDYYVRFNDIKFNEWIIAPDGFNLGFCNGECAVTFASKIQMTGHAYFQAAMHAAHPEVVPLACCVPTKLSTMTVLYFADENQVVLKKYDNMILDACGCL